MSVSIAMATYNGARFLQEQLDSLARQTLLPAELVVTDDGSTDNTITILEAFAKAAPFAVRIIRNEERMGYRANFMKAASLCTGEYIAFCDQDDVWLPAKLSTCMASFADSQTLLVYHNATVVNEELQPIGTLDAYRPPAVMNPPLSLGALDFSPGFTEVIHRSLLGYNEAWKDSHDPFDRQQPEPHDKWFFYLASALGKVGYISDPLALYRRHEHVTTNWKGPSGIRYKVQELLRTNVEGIHALEYCFAARADALQTTTATHSITRLRVLEAFYRQRKELYLTPSIFRRVARFGDLVASGAYRSKAHWGVGAQAAVRDLICGVLAFRTISS